METAYSYYPANSSANSNGFCAASSLFIVTISVIRAYLIFSRTGTFGIAGNLDFNSSPFSM
jgi:hypothetical protein